MVPNIVHMKLLNNTIIMCFLAAAAGVFAAASGAQLRTGGADAGCCCKITQSTIKGWNSRCMAVITDR